MTFILQFVRSNDIIASGLGILANVFLVYLIFTVNKQKLKQMSQTLLQNCVLDFGLALITLVGTPQTVVVNGIYYNIVGSHIRSFGYPFASLLIGVYGTSLTLSIMAMPIPFYIRYLVLCKDTVITKMRILKIYLLLFFLTIILLFACIWCCWPFPGTYEKYAPALMTKFWLDEYISGPTFCAIHPGNIRLITAFFMMSNFSMTAYFLVCYFSFKIVKHLRGSEHHMSHRTKQLNKQLLKTLAVQAIGPLLTANLPMCGNILMIFTQYENNELTLACSCLLGWVAVINPVAAIVIIKPYRDYIKTLLRIKTSPTSTSVSKYETPSQQIPQSSSTKPFTISSSKVLPISSMNETVVTK